MATTKKDELQINVNGSLTDALQQLINQYNNTPGYEQKTADQIRTQAEGEYQSYYDQLRLAARQSQEQSDLALQQQRAGLQDTYDRQREESRKAYEDAYSRAGRQQLSRGMQRSSYAAQVLANLTQQGAEAQDTIGRQQAAAEGNIDAQRTQLAQQLAQQLMQYDAGQAADVLKRMRDLEDQEYERGMTSTQYKNSLTSQIYQYMQQMAAEKAEQDRWQAQMDYQKQRDAIADAQWQQQFAESVRQFDASLAAKSGGGSSSGSRSSGNSSSTKTTGSGVVQTGVPLSDFLNRLGNTTSTTGTKQNIIAGALSVSQLNNKKRPGLGAR